MAKFDGLFSGEKERINKLQQHNQTHFNLIIYRHYQG